VIGLKPFSASSCTASNIVAHVPEPLLGTDGAGTRFSILTLNLLPSGSATNILPDIGFPLMLTTVPFRSERRTSSESAHVLCSIGANISRKNKKTGKKSNRCCTLHRISLGCAVTRLSWHTILVHQWVSVMPVAWLLLSLHSFYHSCRGELLTPHTHHPTPLPDQRETCYHFSGDSGALIVSVAGCSTLLVVGHILSRITPTLDVLPDVCGEAAEPSASMSCSLCARFACGAVRDHDAGKRTEWSDLRHDCVKF